MHKLNGYKIFGDRYLKVCKNHSQKLKSKNYFDKIVVNFIKYIKSKINNI
jgi:hypothetical protein